MNGHKNFASVQLACPCWKCYLEAMKELDPSAIKPCLACGGTDAHLESMLPPGRRQEVWRVVCACGQTLQQWSVTQGAAIRAWNRNLASETEDYSRPVPPTRPGTINK